MATVEIWKLVTDVLLAGGLAYLGWRMLSSGKLTQASSRLNELELELKRIISHAEESGKTLGDHLIKRQQELERLLNDIGSAEYRINKVINSAEENKNSLQGERQRLESILNQAREIEPRPVEVRSKANIESDRATEVAARPKPEYAKELYREDPEPPSFDASAARVATSTPRSAQAQFNIYGEPIGAESEPLTTQVEKQITARAQTTPRLSLEEVYKAAAEMLRAGEDLQSVASKTNLGVPELRRIAQVLARPVPVRSAPPAPALIPEVEVAAQEPIRNEAPTKTDPRLGVLGGIKRQVQVL